MNIKKIVSAVTAFALSATMFAGFSIQANAVDNNVSFDFSTLEKAPTFNTNRFAMKVVPSDDIETTTLSGEKGVIQAIPSGNAGNVYSYSRYDFSALVDGASTYTISYKMYFAPASQNSRVLVGVVDPSVREATAKQTLSLNGMIAGVGHFTKENFLRMSSGGNRAFLTDCAENNTWINVSVTVTGDKKVTGSGKISDLGCSAPTALEIVGWLPNGAAVEIDDIIVEATLAPVLTVTKTSTVITSVPITGTVSAKPVTDGVLGIAKDVDLTDVTTLYIKVENPTGAIPTVTLNDAENTVVKPTRTTDVATTVGTDTYFVYQFVGVDASELTDATVSYDGAEDVKL